MNSELEILIVQITTTGTGLTIPTLYRRKEITKLKIFSVAELLRERIKLRRFFHSLKFPPLHLNATFELSRER